MNPDTPQSWLPAIGTGRSALRPLAADLAVGNVVWISASKIGSRHGASVVVDRVVSRLNGSVFASGVDEYSGERVSAQWPGHEEVSIEPEHHGVLGRCVRCGAASPCSDELAEREAARVIAEQETPMIADLERSVQRAVGRRPGTK